jgi:signal transduction histidine kinase
MADRDPFIDYRVRVVRLGLGASWLALAAFAYTGWRNAGLDDATVYMPLSILGGGALIVSVIPWRRLLATRWSDHVVLFWCGLAVAGTLVVQGLSAGEATAAAFLAPVVFASAILVSPIVLLLVSGLALIGYVTALVSDATGPRDGALTLRISAFVLTALLMLVAARGLRTMMRSTAKRLEVLSSREKELAQHEGELTQLYDLSRTIGIGRNLAEVLPEIVGRVAATVRARTGFVLLYRPKQEQLEVMSPLWVAGHTVKTGSYKLQLSDPGPLQRVFTGGSPLIDNAVNRSKLGEFLTELHATQLLAVPLQLESRSLGVLAVADKLEGQFDEQDARQLESLAGPSALVHNQLARNEEAKETSAKMAELAQLKTDFVSVVSHELRTPLTSIIGSLKTLQRPELAPRDPNAQELLGTAERQADRLRSLIEDLLVVSRLDNRALPVRPEAVKLLSFIEEIISDVPGARQWATVLVDPAIDEIRVDPGHLRRIVTNLIDNALKYAPRVTIDVQARLRGSEVYLSVIDHGPGIPYEHHEHIFDRFTQIERRETRGYGGTGLGLSIVRGLSEAMGGRTWFEPTVGGGATFTVALPVRAGTVSRSEEPSAGVPAD